MATFYVDSAAPGGGDGSQALPYNAIPSNAFLTHEWFIRAGSVFALGASTLSGGNGAIVRKWGEGANPVFTFTGEGFSCSTASVSVLIDGIDFTRLGTQGGTGMNCQQMVTAGTSFTFRNGKLTNWTTSLQATRTRTLIVEGCEFTGSSSTYGIRGRAQLTNNCDGWRIKGNVFRCGIDLELYVSDASCTLGAFNDLHIEDNEFIGPAGAGTSMLLRGGGMNATDYAATASITGAGSGGGTLVRDAGSPVWPNWGAGTVLFLAGWANIANFGFVTVVSGGGTRSVVVTNGTGPYGAVLANEAAGIGKGAAVFDPARAFNRPVIRGNVIRNRGETPIFMDCFMGGDVQDNSVLDTVATGSVAAAFEGFCCYRTLVRENTVARMTGPVAVDMMGVFWDGACIECVSLDNDFSGIRPTTANNNAGAALASYFSVGCWHLNNRVSDCRKGAWIGGVATRGGVGNNDIVGCDDGVFIDSSPATGALEVRANAISNCARGIDDSASSFVLGNSWSQNGVDNFRGTLASKDPGAVPAGQPFSLIPPVRQVGAVLEAA